MAGESAAAVGAFDEMRVDLKRTGKTCLVLNGEIDAVVAVVVAAPAEPACVGTAFDRTAHEVRAVLGGARSRKLDEVGAEHLVQDFGEQMRAGLRGLERRAFAVDHGAGFDVERRLVSSFD